MATLTHSSSAAGQRRAAGQAVPAGRSVSSPRSLGLGALVALVVGSTVGGGIFSLPQNMASGAGAGAVLIGWLISGAGMMMLALVYQTLAARQPALDNGVYAYARASAGDLVGFNSAWGYWLSAWIGNVGYLVIFFAALGQFFPIFGEGNTAAAIIAASALLWTLHGLVLGGIRNAALMNTVTTVAKLLPLALFVGLVALAFKVDTFQAGFWGAPKLGSVLDQVKSTMLITVWVFIGIEGASVYSARAARRSDVGKATLGGFGLVLVLLMAVSLLSLGVMGQADLAALKNPSMGAVLEKVVGPWGSKLISIGLMVSVGGALLAWILLAAQTLHTPATDGLLPLALADENPRGSPSRALWVTNGLTQLFLLLTLWSNATYQALIMLATSMILVPYLFSGAYALQSAWRGTGYAAGERGTQVRDIAVGALATAYCLWLLYAAGPKYLLFSALLYAPGLLFFMRARHEQRRPLLTRSEAVAAGLLVAAACVAGYLLSTGALSL
ncbi:arginine-ornithine antiporter [Aquabacterium sp. A7-Y]|uniref:arginine-ornithine antiporter n=1 Tax=Aquabacterium sp. A7-Y TaxID=1349605 RepID=UPI00223DF1D4|nr:arginine-ornithine antiporter [Aquabacterium sp. A7-Y]MCW7541192.1 arginine-ornithine antiporter [Aquabacterium sp. A7-Y]